MEQEEFIEIEEKDTNIVEIYEDLEEVEDERFGQIILMVARDEKLSFKRIFKIERLIQGDQELRKCEHQVIKRLEIENENIIDMLDYSFTKINSENQEYHFVGFYELPDTDLKREIMYRQRTAKNFSDLEIFNLIRDCCNGLYFMQINRIMHGDIRPMYISMSEVAVDVEDLNNSELEEESQKFVFKLADRLANPYPPDLVQLMHLSNNEEIYISPHLFESLMSGEVQVQLNPFKNDVFALGLIVLEMGLFESVQVLYNLDNGEFNYGTLEKMKQIFFEKYDDSILRDLLEKMLEIKEELRLTPFKLQKVLNSILASLENEEGEDQADIEKDPQDPEALNEIVENEDEDEEVDIEIYTPEIDPNNKEMRYFGENKNQTELEDQPDKPEEDSTPQKEDSDKGTDDIQNQGSRKVVSQQNEGVGKGHLSKEEISNLNQSENYNKIVAEKIPENVENVSELENQSVSKEAEMNQNRKSIDVTKQYLQELGEEFSSGWNQEVEGKAAGQNMEVVEEQNEEAGTPNTNQGNGVFHREVGVQNVAEIAESPAVKGEKVILETGAGLVRSEGQGKDFEVKNTQQKTLEIEDLINPELKHLQKNQALHAPDEPFTAHIQPQHDMVYQDHFQKDIPYQNPGINQKELALTHQNDLPLTHHKDMTLSHQKDIPLTHHKENTVSHQKDIPYSHHKDNILSHQKDIPLPHQKDNSLSHQKDIPLSRQNVTHNVERAQPKNYFDKFDNEVTSWQKLQPQNPQPEKDLLSYNQNTSIPGPNYKVPLKQEHEEDVAFHPNLHPNYDRQLKENEFQPDKEMSVDSDVQQVEIAKEIPRNNGFGEDQKFEEKQTENPQEQMFFDQVQNTCEEQYQRMQINPHIDGRILANPQVTQELEHINDQNKDSHIKQLASLAQTHNEIEAAPNSKGKQTSPQNSEYFPKIEQENAGNRQTQQDAGFELDRKGTHESGIPFKHQLSLASKETLKKMTSREVREQLIDQAVQRKGENKHEPDEPFHHSVQVTLNQINSFTNKNTELLEFQKESTLPVATEVSVVKDSEVFNKNTPLAHSFGAPRGKVAGTPHEQQARKHVPTNKTYIYGLNVRLDKNTKYSHHEAKAPTFEKTQDTHQMDLVPGQQAQQNRSEIESEPITRNRPNRQQAYQLPTNGSQFENSQNHTQFKVQQQENVEFTFQKKVAPQIAADFQHSIQQSEKQSLRFTQHDQAVQRRSPKEFSSSLGNQSQIPSQNSRLFDTLSGYQFERVGLRNSFQAQNHEEIRTSSPYREYPVVSNATETFLYPQSTETYHRFREDSIDQLQKNQVKQSLAGQEMREGFQRPQIGVQSQQPASISQQHQTTQNTTTSQMKENQSSPNPQSQQIQNSYQNEITQQIPRQTPVQVKKNSVETPYKSNQSTITYSRPDPIPKQLSPLKNFQKSDSYKQRTQLLAKDPHFRSMAKKLGSYLVTINPETNNRRIVISSSRPVQKSNQRVFQNLASHTDLPTDSIKTSLIRNNHGIQSQANSEQQSSLIFKQHKVSVSASSYTPTTQVNGEQTPMKTSQVMNYHERRNVTPSNTYNISSPKIQPSESYNLSKPKVIRRSRNVIRSSNHVSSYKPRNENVPKTNERLLSSSTQLSGQKVPPKIGFSPNAGSQIPHPTDHISSSRIQSVGMGQSQYVEYRNIDQTYFKYNPRTDKGNLTRNNVKNPKVLSQNGGSREFGRQGPTPSRGYGDLNGMSSTISHSGNGRILSSNQISQRPIQRIKIDKKPFISRNVMINGEIKRSILQPKRESTDNLLNSNYYQKIISQHDPVAHIFKSNEQKNEFVNRKIYKAADLYPRAKVVPSRYTDHTWNQNIVSKQIPPQAFAKPKVMIHHTNIPLKNIVRHEERNHKFLDSKIEGNRRIFTSQILKKS